MNDRVKEVLNGILERFRTGDIPQALAYSVFPIPNIPSAKWSLLNRTLMFFADTKDARGFKQWQEVNRYVKRGTKAFHILAPRLKKKEEDGEEKTILKGFLSVPVFRLEDTEGEPLDYPELKIPKLPLIEVAEKWGIPVKAVPYNHPYYGAYFPKDRKISLATKEEVVFFHELSHAAHEKVLGKLKGGQHWNQEIVGELSAAVLCQLVGKNGDAYLGNSYQYIDSYAKKVDLSPLGACLRVINDVEQVLQLILEGGDSNGRGQIQCS